MWELKKIYFVHSIVIIICGLALVVVGVLVTRAFDYADIFRFTEDDLFCYVYTLCLVGIITILVGVLGMFSVNANRRSKSALILAMSLMLITFILQTSTAGVAIIIRSQREIELFAFRDKFFANAIDPGFTIPSASGISSTPKHFINAVFSSVSNKEYEQSGSNASKNDSVHRNPSTKWSSEFPRLFFQLRRDVYHKRHWCCGWDAPSDFCVEGIAPPSCCHDSDLISGTTCYCTAAFREGCRQLFKNALDIYSYFVGGVSAISAIFTLSGIFWNSLLVLRRKSHGDSLSANTYPETRLPLSLPRRKKSMKDASV